MKRTYIEPVVEKIEFNYEDQVVATSRQKGELFQDGIGRCDCGDTTPNPNS